MICWSHLHSVACSSIYSSEGVSRTCTIGMCKLQNLKLGHLHRRTDEPYFIYSCFKNIDKCKRHSQIPWNDFHYGKWEYFWEVQKASKWYSRNRKVTKSSPDAAGQSWGSLSEYNDMNKGTRDDTFSAARAAVRTNYTVMVWCILYGIFCVRKVNR